MKRVTLLLVLALTPALGCRIGNRVVKAADPTAMSGYYKSEPQTMTVCAFISGQSPQCAATDLSLIPSSITSVMTNPVYVAANTATAKAYLVPNSLDTSAVFEMNLQSSGEMAATPYVDDPAPLWNDPACLSQIQVQKEGQIVASAPQSVGSFQVDGTVQFSLGVLTALGTQCATDLQLMRDCYQDLTQCPGGTNSEKQAQQDAVHGFLDPYLSRGVLTLTDLPNLQGVGWEVSYQ
jgi:hypothetical protein